MSLRFITCVLAGMLGFFACGKSDDGASGRTGACDITSTQSMDMRSCIDFNGLTDAQVEEAAAYCRAPQNDVVKTWQADRNCSSSGRLGRCLETHSGISSTRYSYSTGSTDRDYTVLQQAEAACVADGGSWSAISIGFN